MHWIYFDHHVKQKMQKAKAQLWRLPLNGRSETVADELLVSVVDDDVSWGEGCCTIFGEIT